MSLDRLRRPLAEWLESRLLLTGEHEAAWTVASAGSDVVRAVAVATNGDVLAAGTCSARPAGAPDDIVGGEDLFVARYAPDGRRLWMRTLGSPGDEAVGGLTVAADGSVYVAGAFAGLADFDPSSAGAFALRSGGPSDAFVWKLDADGRFVWARRLLGPGADVASGVAIDPASGEVVVAGNFERTARTAASATAPSLTSAGGTDAFAWRLRPSGVTAAAVRFGGGGDDSASAIAAGADGETLVAGTFTGTMPLAGRSSLASKGGADAFFVKLDDRLNVLAAGAVGGPRDDSAAAAAVGADGNLYLAGSFVDAADFDPGAGTVTLTSAAGSRDAFVLVLDPQGRYRMAKPIGGEGEQSASAVRVDGMGAIYVGGRYRGSPDFDTGSGVYTMPARSGSDGFLDKISAAGRFVYARPFTGRGAQAVEALALGPGNEVLVAGSFAGSIDLDPAAGASHNRLARGAADGFLACLTQSAPTFGFAKLVGQAGLRTVRSIDIDGTDDVYVVGSFTGTIRFGEGTSAITFTSRGGTDAFIGRFCNKCFLLWGRAVGGPGNDEALAVAMREDGRLYVAGSFEQTVDFDPSAGTRNLTSAGGTDAFVATFDRAGNATWAGRFGGAGDDRATGVAIPGTAGGALVAGTFEGSVDVDPGAGTRTLASAGGDDAFLLRLSADDTLAYAVSAGGAGDETVADLAADGAGFAYVAGTFAGAAEFPAGGALSSGTAPRAGFAWKHHPNGGGWARAVAASGGAAAASIAVGPSGDVVVAGSFSGAADLDPGPGVAVVGSRGGTDGFLLDLTASGARRWSRTLGGAQDDALDGVILDRTGCPLVVGTFDGRPLFNAGQGARGVFASAGDSDVLVARFTPAGRLSWWGSVGGAGADEAVDIAAGGGGAFVYPMGHFTGSGDFDPTGGVFTLAGGNGAAGRDAFFGRVLF